MRPSMPPTLPSMPSARKFGTVTLIGAVIYTLLNLNLFVTHAQLQDELRRLEHAINSQYATRQDINDVKVSLDKLNTKLDKLADRF